MNKIFPIDRKNQTITAQPGALLIDIQAAAAAGGLFYPRIRGKRLHPLAVMSLQMPAV